MNFQHLKSFVGIAKILALLVCLVAACLGTAAFSMSAYNKSCRDGDSSGLFQPTTEVSAITIGVNQESTTETPEPKDMAPVLWMERFQISCAWMATMISLILLVLYLVKEDFEYSKFLKAANFTFYFTFCILLIVSSVFLAFAAIEIDRQICQPSRVEKREDCEKYMGKMSAAGFTLLGGIFYGVISGKILASKLYEQV